MRHWIQSVKERWKTTSPKVEENNSKYTPSEDFIERVNERQAAEKVRKEKWSKELKQRMSSNNYTYSTSIGHLPGGNGSSNITTTSMADAKIHINGGANGSMRVDVPLIVNGRDVIKELDEMRDSLLLLKRNVDMEAKYPRLRELKDEYERALEKYKTFDTIKGSK